MFYISPQTPYQNPDPCQSPDFFKPGPDFFKPGPDFFKHGPDFFKQEVRIFFKPKVRILVPDLIYAHSNRSWNPDLDVERGTVFEKCFYLH